MSIASLTAWLWLVSPALGQQGKCLNPAVTMANVYGCVLNQPKDGFTYNGVGAVVTYGVESNEAIDDNTDANGFFSFQVADPVPLSVRVIPDQVFFVPLTKPAAILGTPDHYILKSASKVEVVLLQLYKNQENCSQQMFWLYRLWQYAQDDEHSNTQKREIGQAARAELDGLYQPSIRVPWRHDANQRARLHEAAFNYALWLRAADPGGANKPHESKEGAAKCT